MSRKDLDVVFKYKLYVVTKMKKTNNDKYILKNKNY